MLVNLTTQLQLQDTCRAQLIANGKRLGVDGKQFVFEED
jgi:hypothetical protein